MHGFPVLSRRVTWALVVLAGATRLAVALADHRSLIANDVYPDDAFYYLRIAANVVAGRGLTFDGLAPTNGFQPLYFILLLPIVALSHGSLVFPIHASGVLLAVWAAGTAAVLRALLQRLAGPGVALFGLLLWAVCPYFILMSVNGLETGPAMFFTLLVPLLYLSWFFGDASAGAKRALAFGVVCGLAVLARLDLSLLVAAVAADALLRGLRRPGRAAALPAALALAGTLGIWLPWALVSHAQTGHWIPLSGAASREIALDFGWLNLQPVWSSVGPEARLFDPRHVPAGFTFDVATKLAVVFLFEHPLLGPLRANVLVGPWAELDDYVPYRLLLKNPPLFAGLAMAVGAAVIAVAWRRARARVSAVGARDERRPSLRRLVVVFLVLVAVGYSLYAPTHWYFNRYLAGPILLATAYLLVEVAAPAARAGRRRAAVALVAVAIIGCQLAQWRFFARLRWSDAPAGGFLATWHALGSRVDPEARIGAFQAGIYGWFSGRDIVNLDGKVNQDAAGALRDKRLHEYIRRQGIRYVLDGQRMLHALCARHAPPGAAAFRSIAQDPSGSGVQLFEVTVAIDRPRGLNAIRVAAMTVIIVVAFIRVGRTWSVFSATADEPQHIAAGIEWHGRTDTVQHEPWRTVNPPVARIAVGLGPYLAGAQSTPYLRDMLYTGPGYESNLVRARPGVLPFLALAIVLTWVLARRAHGEAAAWVAAVAISCVPAVLGHGGLATTDVPFMATFLLALLALMRWIEEPTRGRAIAAGLALGLAGATKFSALVLPAIAVLAALARRSLGPRPGSARRLLAQAPLAALGAAVVVWGAYRFAVAAPATLWQPEWLQDTVNACFPSARGQRAAAWLLAHRLPAPGAFLAALGICAQEAPGRSTAYLLGHLTQDGFPAFFLLAIAVKLPLPLGALAICGFVATLRERATPELRFRALAPLLAIAVYLAMVIPSRTNIGVRHVLPLFPLLAVLAGHGVVTLWRAIRWRVAARAAAVAALSWVLVIPFAAAPDYFPWFNALAGRHPERILIDSDLDWGQDLFRLERALADRRAASVSIAYFGASDICRHKLPQLTWLRPREPAHGLIAISETFRRGIDGSYYRNGDPCDRSQLVGTFLPDVKQYAWLDAYQPVGRVGTSILLYDVP